MNNYLLLSVCLLLFSCSHSTKKTRTLANINENIVLDAGEIEIGTCSVHTQGIQKTPYGEFSIRYPQHDVSLKGEMKSFKDFAFVTFVGGIVESAEIKSKLNTVSIRVYKSEGLSALEHCNQVRSSL